MCNYQQRRRDSGKGKWKISVDQQKKEADISGMQILWHGFYNSENGYTVATYATDEPLPEKAQKENGQFVAVGYELPQESGLNYSFSGKWKDSAKYGEQFHVESVQIHLPTTGEGVKAYLSSGLIKGIGPALAERIVEKFGKHTFYVFEQCPQRLLEIPGISERKLEEIKESYRKSESLRKLSFFFHQQE